MIEQFNGKMLEDILKSKDFVGTLSRSMDITRDRGYETSFTIAKKAGGSELIYSPYIKVGNENSVGGLIGLKRAKKNYEKATGNRVNIMNPNEDFVEYCESKEPVKIPLEITDYTKFFSNRFEAEKYFPLIHFHTHPERAASPSSADLMNLESMEGMAYIKDIFSKPIGIIAGKVPKSDYAPLMVIQKKDPDLDMDEDVLKDFSDAFYKYYNKVTNPNNFYAELIFGKSLTPIMKGSSVEAPKKLTDTYNVGILAFDARKKKIITKNVFVGGDKDMNFSEFGFSGEIEDEE